ncbi:hypothetical protein pdam_00012411 [Pocillopora damicornis]|uniref:Uracil-DNA glycosylase-like domain-containing protein n=1 Tax=Pocillopora damicornis TaxID=46731 RepID=A0A3M6TZD4_POCDA|nr:hypothetical protein pdam_00012411 [Pocillopora damicornis]
MQTQKTISSFFSPSGTGIKRRAEDEDAGTDENANSPPLNPKRLAVNLSPEQRARIEANRKEAQKKLLANKSPQFFGPTWKKALAAEFTKEYFQKLMNFVKEERSRKTVYPPGLCFSVPPGVGIPPSLVNIYKELQNDIEGFEPPKHGYLLGWAKQGVLLLNACLTVVASQANSHKDKGWEKFTDAVIRWINTNLHGVVFLLWGSYAQKKGSFIDKKKHHVLKAVHPSPLSAHRGFLGCKHFSQANAYLKKSGKRPVNWCNLPSDENEAVN